MKGATKGGVGDERTKLLKGRFDITHATCPTPLLLLPVDRYTTHHYVVIQYDDMRHQNTADTVGVDVSVTVELYVTTSLDSHFFNLGAGVTALVRLMIVLNLGADKIHLRVSARSAGFQRAVRLSETSLAASVAFSTSEFSN